MHGKERDDEMYYEYIEERIMTAKCGDLDAFGGLVMEGCGSLYLYAAMLRETKEERLRLVKNTYVSAWNSLQRLEIPNKYDVWLKGLMWKQAAIETNESEDEVRRTAVSGVNDLIKQAFASAENYWYLGIDDKKKLAESVMDDIRTNRWKKIS